MYFANRAQAGRLLAAQLVPKYRYENCIVVALSDGGAVIGAQLAMQLHCSMNMLLYEEIRLPQENMALSGLAADGSYAFNSNISKAERDEMLSEYFGYVEQQRFIKLSEMNRRLGRGHDLIDRKLLKGRDIIMASDGILDPFALDIAAQYLKPVDYSKLIIATPFATIDVVDTMHVLADDLYCLDVVEDTFGVDHYYDQDDVPDHQTVVNVIENIVLHWK